MIDRIEFLKNFITELKAQGYSDWWIGSNTAIILRVLDLILQDESQDSGGKD